MNQTSEPVAGIILTVNKTIFYDEVDYKKIVKGDSDRFHVPEEKKIFGSENLKVFLYNKTKGGIFAYFNSKGFFDDEKDEDYCLFYFKIEKPFIELEVSKRLSQDKLILILGKNSEKFNSWSRRGQPYQTLTQFMVDKIMENIRERY